MVIFPQYIGFVGRITYENRPTVVLNTSHLLYVHSELTSYTKQHEVRHTVETSAAGLREERHRISYIVEVFRHPAAKEPRLTCPISPATHWRKVWSWMPSDPYNYIFHRFFDSILHHVTYWGFFFWLGPRLGRPGGKTIQQAGNWWTTLQTARSAFLP